MAEFEIDLVATDGKVWSGTARQLVAPSVDGEMGILAGHTPVLAVLRPGEIRVYPGEGAVQRWSVDGGFLSFDENRATIVVDAVSSEPQSAAAAH
ncbi:F0F1 ATP synthase subunit epsilon [Cellulomonas sp. HZM]|uniref:F0F1 ATP synthase subunit epsilon n=1 Tax=Cellulomonas sp. HZM TaxID=1454010 RepID=UPI000492FB0C|nr:F0F1 ATP synthase subunit epsilon [Cellulomonas sp. HZM]